MTRARILLLLFLAVVGAGPRAAVADVDWPRRLFKTTSHDFGVVARGAVVEYRFEMENPFVEDVHIERVESSCGCSQPTITKPLLKTYETGAIVVRLDTQRFRGRKDATLRVVFDKPFRAEFRLEVYSYIRPDVVFQPGAVQFGSVAQGQSAKKRVTVSYAGQPTWKVIEVKPSSSFLDAALAEIERTIDPRTQVGKVTYDLTVTLRDHAPPGYLKEFVVLHTNDPNQQTALISLTVEGLVVPSLSVHPAVLMFDVVPAGESVSKNLVVRGHKPFRIVEVAGPDPRFRFSVPKSANQYRSADATYYSAVIAVEFRSGDVPGKISGKIQIKTDVPGADPLQVSVAGQVAAGTLEKIDRAKKDGGAQKPDR